MACEVHSPLPRDCNTCQVWIGSLQRGNLRLPDPVSRFYLFKMDIKDLTQLMHDFVQSKGWYSPWSARPQSPRNLAISLSLEVAEVLENFQWNEDYLGDDLAGELADVALYLLQLASVTGVDLEAAILDKLNENQKRNWDDSKSNRGADT